MYIALKYSFYHNEKLKEISNYLYLNKKQRYCLILINRTDF